MKQDLIALRSLTYKEVKRVFRIWKQTLLPPVVTTTLYFLIFWTFIWSQVWDVNWVDYIKFLVPWFIMMSLITASYANVSSSFFGAKFQRYIEELITSPMSNTSVILWYISWWIIRWMLISIIVFIVASFFTDISVSHPFISLLFVFFTASLFSLAWFLNAFFAKSFDDVNIIPTFIITPLIYLGWVFYSANSLSGFWKFLTELNPIYYMINGLRYGIIGQSDINIYVSLFAIIIFNIIFFIANLYLFKKWYWLKN
jgi:ABC-2 type transport system permease protein